MCLLEGAVQCRFTRIKPQMCSVMDDVVFLYHYQTKLRVMCKLDHAFGNSKLNTSYSTHARTHTHTVNQLLLVDVQQAKEAVHFKH